MATQTTLTLTNEMKTFYDKVLLERALPSLVHAQFAQRRPLGRRQGKVIEFRKFSPLAIPSGLTALTESVTPAGTDLTVTLQTATLNQYGDYVQGSDLLDLTAIDPVLTETAELLGEQAGLWIDRVIREVLMAGTSVRYASTATSRITVAAGMVLTVADVRKAVRDLKVQNTKGIRGGRLDGPNAGSGDYVAFIHPRAIFDIQSDTAWKNPHEYSDTQNVYSGEVGRLYGVRFIESTEAKVFTGLGAAGIDVYATLFVGSDAYGIVPLDGGDLAFYFKPVG